MIGIELGRYFYARAEIAKTADAAALAAAAEISQRVFEETGDLQPTGRTWANAQAYASMNNSYLAQYGVNAVVTGISVDAGNNTVLVQVSANLERLFPSVVPEVIVTERGFAEIRAFTR
jgi:Flp pilus assembly protein TadG